jgi:hypothetical protein
MAGSLTELSTRPLESSSRSVNGLAVAERGLSQVSSTLPLVNAPGSPLLQNLKPRSDIDGVNLGYGSAIRVWESGCAGYLMAGIVAKMVGDGPFPARPLLPHTPMLPKCSAEYRDDRIVI